MPRPRSRRTVPVPAMHPLPPAYKPHPSARQDTQPIVVACRPTPCLPPLVVFQALSAPLRSTTACPTCRSKLSAQTSVRERQHGGSVTVARRPGQKRGESFDHTLPVDRGHVGPCLLPYLVQ